MKMKKSRSGKAAETVPLPASPQCSAQPDSRKRTVDELPYPIPAILLEGDESDPPAPAVGPVEECAPSPAAQAGHVELEDESNTPRLAVGPVEERAPSNAAQAAPDEGEGTGLPEAYGTRTLLLTAQAPHWLYAHWDIAREEQRQYSAPADGRQLVLRVYERAVSSSPTAQIQVQPDSREWFVHVPRSATQYVAELGCSSSGGLWQSLATSEVAVTPADGVSQDQRVEFATIEPPTHQAQPPRQDPAVPRAPLPPAAEAPAQSPLEEAPLPDLAEVVPQPQARLRLVLPPAAASQAGVFEQFVAKARPGQPEPGSAEIARLLGPRAEPEGITSPAGPPSITAASAGAGEESPEGFWLNVNAELVLYGATEPDAQVAIAGQPILLRPDGSFSYRFALPDGHYDLMVTAVSARKEQRSVRLQFSRRTD